MGRRSPALFTAILVVILMTAALGAVGSARVLRGTGPSVPTGPQSRATANALLAPAGTAIVLAAGDIVECGSDEPEATARILDRFPRATVAALGDVVYEEGTTEEFEECYGPTWGRHRARTRPAIGNHEMDTDAGGPFYDYFGRRAGPAGRGWYSFDLSADWHAIVLNSNCDDGVDCDRDSEQLRWLVRDLRANRDQHVIAWMHHPRFSSGTRHGSDDEMQPFFGALARNGADVLLASHDHHYERFAPLDARGRPSATGLVQFVVGTGGRSLYELGDREAQSVVAEDEHYGVLRLRLTPDGYAWRFLALDRAATVDVGSRSLP